MLDADGAAHAVADSAEVAGLVDRLWRDEAAGDLAGAAGRDDPCVGPQRLANLVLDVPVSDRTARGAAPPRDLREQLALGLAEALETGLTLGQVRLLPTAAGLDQG